MVIDFSQPNALRQFELVTSDGRSLWANGFFLAEISPYFYALCVAGDFKERKLKRAELRDVNYDDLHELLRCVCPEDFAYENKIGAENFALLTNLSGRLLLQNLRSQLEEFARVENNFENVPPVVLLEVIVEVMEAGFDSETPNTTEMKLSRYPDTIFSIIEWLLALFFDRLEGSSAYYLFLVFGAVLSNSLILCRADRKIDDKQPLATLPLIFSKRLDNIDLKVRACFKFAFSKGCSIGEDCYITEGHFVKRNTLMNSLPDKYSSLVEQKIQPFLEFYHQPGGGTLCGVEAQPAAGGSPHYWNNIRLFF